MATDIHHVIERRAPDGWYAVLSKSEIHRLCDLVDPDLERLRSPGILDTPHPDLPEGLSRGALHHALGLGDRDYALFSAVSHIRCGDRHTAALARPGFPADASKAAHDALPRSGSDLHTHGWFLLDDLENRACRSPDAQLQDLHRDLFDAMAQSANDGVITTAQAEQVARKASAIALEVHEDHAALIGFFFALRRLDEALLSRPLMPKRSSAHERLALARAAERLAPITGETLRVIIAYDN